MKRIGHRATAFLLCAVLLFGLSISASARESQCISSYDVKVSAVGNGKVSIQISILATDAMQELGAKMIVVNEKQANGSYKAVYTFTPDGYASLIAKDRVNFAVKTTYQGTSGKQYYITAQLYAKNAKASSTIWAGSQTVKA